jgi:hypothetical protein
MGRTSQTRTVRLTYVDGPDLHPLLRENPDPATGPLDDLTGMAPSSSLELTCLSSAGWSRTVGWLRSHPPVEGCDVLLVSASSELADPSSHPREALIELARLASERMGAHLIASNGSTLLGASRGERVGASRTDDPLDLRIRRLNLLIMEASNATGLSVLDVDRIVAETRLPGKVTTPFAYAPEMNVILRSALVSILGALGFAERGVMEVRVPFIREVATVSVDRWLKSEGEVVAADEVICHLSLSGMWKLQRPRNATVLASIRREASLLERFLARERVQKRTLEAVVSLVARDTAILRKVVRAAGSVVRSGEPIGLFSGDADVPIEDRDLVTSPFRATILTDDPKLEALL